MLFLALGAMTRERLASKPIIVTNLCFFLLISEASW